MIPFDQREFLKDLTGCIWRPQLMDVFRADGWDFVTNGYALLRLRGESPLSEGPREMPPIGPIIEIERPNVRTTNMDALCAWARICGDYRRACAYCESPSDFVETNRIGFAGTEINRCLLWHYLKPLPREGELRVSWGDPKQAILIAHADWELFVMPLGEPDAKYTRPFAFDGEA